jgi:hypothetical protein
MSAVTAPSVSHEPQLAFQVPRCWRAIDSVGGVLRVPQVFSDEQTAAALQIWLPILGRLQRLLDGTTDLFCPDTPNGLIIRSSAGWTLLMCCLQDEASPHFIAVRSDTPSASINIKAFLQDGSYRLTPNEQPDPGLKRVMQAVLHGLGYKRFCSNGASRRVRSPRSQPATPARSAERLKG